MNFMLPKEPNFSPLQHPYKSTYSWNPQTPEKISRPPTPIQREMSPFFPLPRSYTEAISPGCPANTGKAKLHPRAPKTSKKKKNFRVFDSGKKKFHFFFLVFPTPNPVNLGDQLGILYKNGVRTEALQSVTENGKRLERKRSHKEDSIQIARWCMRNQILSLGKLLPYTTGFEGWWGM